VALVSLAIAALSGCGKGGSAAPAPGSAQLTVYSSLPLQGPSRLQSVALVNAEKLALSQVGGRVGPFTVKYVSMDDSRAGKGRWDPGTVLSNARRAVQDRSAIAYIGEADSGASAIAIPVLNEAGILTVSPASTYAGLTTTVDADKGEPEKYYPSGARTFARVVPADNRQAAVQVALQRQSGCQKLLIVGDRDVYGRGIATAVAREATADDVEVVGSVSLRNGQTDFSDVTKQARTLLPDCIFAGVTLSDAAVALFEALHAGAPLAQLFGPDALTDPGFAAALEPATAHRTLLTSLAQGATPTSRRARAFARDYRARYGRAPEAYAIYGYEAMRAVLTAIANSANNGNRRDVVLRAFFGLRNRDSVLGRYSISAQGDTSLDRYSVEKIAGGRLVSRGVMRAGG
jgi:branched-chain amino acid transport system substrate-binding protein